MKNNMFNYVDVLHKIGCIEYGVDISYVKLLISCDLYYETFYKNDPNNKYS